jgi:Uma2 family endonuclease
MPVPVTHEAWTLEEEPVPETPLHEQIIQLLVLVFQCWIARTGRDAGTGRNIALRWDRQHPQRGVDPDVYLVEPALPGGALETSLRTWEKGHHPPRIAVEVVSENTAEKDYTDGPARYAASRTRELWIFDPLKLGPGTHGGPWVLQVWRRAGNGRFSRVYQGDGPAFSRELGVWLVVTDGGLRLRIANDALGSDLWPTLAEFEHAARLQEHAARLQEHAARVAAESRAAEHEAEVERLRAELARLREG